MSGGTNAYPYPMPNETKNPEGEALSTERATTTNGKQNKKKNWKARSNRWKQSNGNRNTYPHNVPNMYATHPLPYPHDNPNLTYHPNEYQSYYSTSTLAAKENELMFGASLNVLQLPPPHGVNDYVDYTNDQDFVEPYRGRQPRGRKFFKNKYPRNTKHEEGESGRGRFRVFEDRNDVGKPHVDVDKTELDCGRQDMNEQPQTQFKKASWKNKKNRNLVGEEGNMENIKEKNFRKNYKPPYHKKWNSKRENKETDHQKQNVITSVQGQNNLHPVKPQSQEDPELVTSNTSTLEHNKVPPENGTHKTSKTTKKQPEKSPFVSTNAAGAAILSRLTVNGNKSRRNSNESSSAGTPTTTTAAIEVLGNTPGYSYDYPLDPYFYPDVPPFMQQCNPYPYGYNTPYPNDSYGGYTEGYLDMPQPIYTPLPLFAEGYYTEDQYYIPPQMYYAPNNPSPVYYSNPNPPTKKQNKLNVQAPVFRPGSLQ